MTKKIREKTQLTKLSNKGGDITTDLMETENYKQLYASILNNLVAVDKFLERHNYQNRLKTK